jgi:hypothetical protein
MATVVGAGFLMSVLPMVALQLPTALIGTFPGYLATNNLGGGGTAYGPNGTTLNGLNAIALGLGAADVGSSSTIAILPYRWGLKRLAIATLIKSPELELVNGRRSNVAGGGAAAKRRAVPFAVRSRMQRQATHRMTRANFLELYRARIKTGKNTQEAWQAELRAAAKAGTLEPTRFEKARAARVISPKRKRENEKVAAARARRLERPTSAKRTRENEKVAAARARRLERPTSAKRTRENEKVAAARARRLERPTSAKRAKANAKATASRAKKAKRG